MKDSALRRRSGDGTPYEEYDRCTLPLDHAKEQIRFHCATDGRKSFVWIDGDEVVRQFDRSVK